MTAEEQTKMDVLVACVDRFERVVGDPDDFIDDETIVLDDNDPGEIRVERDGHFVFSAKNVGRLRASSFAFVCAGNANKRRIEFLEMGTIKHRPGPGEIWSF